MQIIHVAIVLLLAGWAFLNYIRFVKRRDENLKRQYEISLSPNSGKRYEYELWIRKMGHEQVIHLYSDSPRHHIDSIHHYFYHQSKKAYVFKTSDTNMIVPLSDIYYLELRSRQRLSDVRSIQRKSHR